MSRRVIHYRQVSDFRGRAVEAGLFPIPCITVAFHQVRTASARLNLYLANSVVSQYRLLDCYALDYQPGQVRVHLSEDDYSLFSSVSFLSYSQRHDRSIRSCSSACQLQLLEPNSQEVTPHYTLSISFLSIYIREEGAGH